jgi:hypothetical protein
MRAVWYDRQGSADEVLVCGELPTPEAAYGQVRVRLEASGVNPSDTYRRRGPPAMEYPDLRSAVWLNAFCQTRPVGGGKAPNLVDRQLHHGDCRRRGATELSDGRVRSTRTGRQGAR